MNLNLKKYVKEELDFEADLKTYIITELFSKYKYLHRELVRKETSSIKVDIDKRGIYVDFYLE